MTKKLALLLAVLMLAASLTVGCTAQQAETPDPTQTTTEPTDPNTEPPTAPPTDPPTEPATEEPTAASAEDLLAACQALFSWEGSMIYSHAAGHVYTRPEDVDLYYLFYNGVNYPGSWDSITEAERELLLGANFWDEMDIQILPASLLEETLQQYFGVGLDAVTIPAEWVYSAETDTYYSNHNDAYGCGVTVMDLEKLPDGTIRLHMTVDAVHDHDFQEVVWNASMHMTLRPMADGSYQIISNTFAEE